MIKAITSLFLILAIVFAPMITVEAKSGPARLSFANFQTTLNQISRTRSGPAAQNATIAAYARFARSNPNTAPALVRMATVQLNRVTPVSQRAANTVRMANASSSAFVAAGTNDTSLFASTFTYLVSTVPPQSRTPDVMRSIGQAAVNASVGTGGTPQQSIEIINAIIGSNNGVIPTS